MGCIHGEEAQVLLSHLQTTAKGVVRLVGLGYPTPG